jgi:hypothetical protein
MILKNQVAWVKGNSAFQIHAVRSEAWKAKERAVVATLTIAPSSHTATDFQPNSVENLYSDRDKQACDFAKDILKPVVSLTAGSD